MTDGAKEFTLIFRSHKFGSSIGLAAEPGFLYTDFKEKKVHRRALALGRDCGIRLETDEVVEGLSPWAVRGVILAHRYGEGKEVVLMIDDGEGDGRMEVYIGGHLKDLGPSI
ncbi:MAG TPA: hypothetical protein VGJ94_01930 [Syntrophorhabdaceae bacterium]